MIFNKMIFLHHSDVDPDYLCFTSPNAFSVGMSKNGEPTVPSLEYSKDKATWTTFTAGTTTVSANANEKVYLRGNNEYINNSETARWHFSLTGTDIRASGNIMSLLDASCASTTITTSFCFIALFYGCASLTNGPTLPAATLAENCYQYMFVACSSLTTAPMLPATTLAKNCYMGMFYYCTSLTVPPVLSATTLAEYCCYSMFAGCSSLATAPILSANILADYCYNNMFNGCTELVNVPKLSATTLANGCYGQMFRGCTSLSVYSSSGEGHTYAWAIPTSGTASGYTTQYGMFLECPGDYEEAETVTLNQTFYTQNEPV